MAKIELLLQAFGDGVHATALKRLLSLPKLNRFVASVAYVSEEGINAIAAELKANSKKCVFFIGIRNEITSIQAVLRLLKLGVRLFVVDTATRSTKFHPKMFFGVSPRASIAIVGSANVTFSGLHNNIEASTILKLDPAEKDDARFLRVSLDSIDKLPIRFPEHVFQIQTKADAIGLFNEGRLVDEKTVVATPARSSVRKGRRDTLRPINLPRHLCPTHAKRVLTLPKLSSALKKAKKTSNSTITGAGKNSDLLLVWESKSLTERDLNIPKEAGTNPTGSMLWKKGAVEGIDQRHFFRDEVFTDLHWIQDPNRAHYHRAEADFELVIKGLNYGMYRLKLSHNTMRNSKTYRQKNAMTSVSWGPVTRIIGKRDLLGRTMSLYRNSENPPKFLIEID